MFSSATLLWSPLTPIRIGSVLAGTGKTMTVNAVANELGILEAWRAASPREQVHHTAPHHTTDLRACVVARAVCLSCVGC
jgi:hypothetical protein